MKINTIFISAIWLCAVGILIFFTGIIFLFLGFQHFFSNPEQYRLAEFYTYFPQNLELPDPWWIYSFFGTLCFLTGPFLFYLAVKPFRHIVKWAWNTVFITIMIWFTIGASVSILYMVYFDMILYATLLILALFPLLFTQERFVYPPNLL